MTEGVDGLRELARLHGIRARYRDGFGEDREAPAASVMAALRAMGAEVEGAEDVPAALREARARRAARIVEPARVSWTDEEPAVHLTLPAGSAGVVECRLEPRAGSVRSWRARVESLPAVGEETTGERRRVRLRLPLPAPLPPGIHALTVEAGEASGRSWVIRAPARAWVRGTEEETPAGGLPGAHGGDASPGPRAEPGVGDRSPRGWGAFLPLHALRTDRDWGVGDFADLEALLAWTGERGGEVTGVLPLHASYLDRPFEPSPYVPVSRLFWNELFVAPDALPELADAPETRRLLASAEVRRRREALRARERVDYREAAALKRGVVESLLDEVAAGPAGGPPAFRAFVEETPGLRAYARFRAAAERRSTGWPSWEEPARGGELGPRDYDPGVERYHLFAQWLARRQLEGAAAAGRRAGAELYLDLPLGAHAEGFDTWRHRHVFARGVSAGAPPDAFNAGGQAWGFPPLAPGPLRRDGYRYWEACLDALLPHASLLRVDHVMGLHRLFWVPDGAPATEGLYVRYPAEELYGVLCLASWRHRTELVGEDLGTVPDEVREAMERRRLRRMYVLPFELEVDGEGAPAEARIPPPRPDALAALNTHDLPTWAGHWRARDAELRAELGQLDHGAVEEERRERRRIFEALERGLGTAPEEHADATRRAGETSESASPSDARLRAALRATLRRLAASPARLLLVNLEDLWLEEGQQNLPGTCGDHPNWRRRARYQLDELDRLPGVRETLEAVERERGDEGTGGSSTP